MTWTPQRIQTLKTLWKQGVSAANIAEELGDITRNAVCGKAYRLGMSNPITSPSPKNIKKPAKRLPTGLKPIKYARHRTHGFNPKSPGTRSEPHKRQIYKANTKAISFDELTPTTCRFTVGEGTGLDQKFCGKKTNVTDTYCKKHHAIVWIPGTSRNARRAGT